MNFRGKIAIVTGGAQGIGRACCCALLNVGMKVCICDINEDIANEFIDSLPENNKNDIIFQKCDVTVFEEFKGVFEKVISVFGRIDLVVNNAGILNEYEWRKMIDINFIGVIHGIQLGFLYMDINKGGYGGFIVNTASSSGFNGFYAAPVYAACKHAVIGLTKSYGMDEHFKKTGVKVSAVCPSGVETELFQKIPETILNEEEGKRIVKRKTLKPEDVADALIRVLTDGRNGAFLRLDTTGAKYAD